MRRIGQIQADDETGACAAFNFQQCIALELEGDAAEGSQVKVDRQGLVEVAVEGQIQAEHIGGGVVGHIDQTTRIIAGQAERFDDAVAQVLDGVGRIGGDVRQDVFEWRADVNQVGDAEVEDGYLGSDERQCFELGVEEGGEAADGVEDAVGAAEEQVGEVEQVLGDEVQIGGEAGDAGQGVANGEGDVEGQAGERVDPRDGVGDVDAVEGEAAAPARGGHDQQAVLRARTKMQFTGGDGVEVGDFKRLGLEGGE